MATFILTSAMFCFVGICSAISHKELSLRLNEVENLVSAYQSLNKKISGTVKHVSSELTNLLQSYTNVTVRRSLELGSYDQQTTYRSRVQKKTIGFSAVMSSHNENLNLQDTVKFQNLLNNDGNGFDHVTSIFRAPVRGLYFFNTVILSHASEDMETEIVKNGDGIVRTYSGDSKTWNAGTQSTVLYLDIGDQVWVRILNAVPSVNNGNIRIFGSGFSSFSGFLISE